MNPRPWSKAPTTEHDITIEARPEIRVFSGYNKVEDISTSKSGKAANVVFNTPSYTNNGWVPASDKLLEVVKYCKDNDIALEYRIEQSRLSTVDPNIPISELTGNITTARKNTVKRLVAVKPDNTGRWIISRTIKSIMPGEVDKSTGEDLDKKEIVYTKLESDKTRIPLKVYSLVSQHLKDSGRKDVNEKTKFMVTNAVLKISGNLQVKMSAGEMKKPDLTNPSFESAIELVLDSLNNEYIELPHTLSNDTLQHWAQKTESKCLKMWQWSMTVVKDMTI